MIWLLSLFNLLTVVKSTDLQYCDIKGNVKNPGVYQVDEGDVINDIIEKAGGLKKNSYVKNINLSKKVNDEMVIYIMSLDEYEELTKECPVCVCEVPVCEEAEMITTNETTTKEVTTTETTTNTVTFKTTTTKVIDEVTTTIKILEEKININTASVSELMTLSGIGESRAKAIISYREENGKFKSIER